MLARLLRRVLDTGRAALSGLRRRARAATKPATIAPLAGALADLRRSKPALVAEQAFLRQQLLALRRGVKRPRCGPADRARLVLLASRVRAWRQAPLLVQPDTLLRWHRQLLRGFWRRKSRATSTARRAKVSAATIALIREMATANRRRGAGRMRGELLKLDGRLAKWTVQKYMRDARPPQRAGRGRSTFRRNHAGEIWACDFLPVTDLPFRPLYACFVIAHESRHVVRVGVTRHPTDARIAQQRREATPSHQRPRFLIRDRDSTYGPACTRVAAAMGITELRAVYRAPRRNATGARFLGSIRRACLDHVLVLGAAHLRHVLRAYVAHFNTARPHQGLPQRVPEPAATHALRAEEEGRLRAVPILGALHHMDLRAA